MNIDKDVYLELNYSCIWNTKCEMYCDVFICSWLKFAWFPEKKHLVMFVGHQCCCIWFCTNKRSLSYVCVTLRGFPSNLIIDGESCHRQSVTFGQW